MTASSGIASLMFDGGETAHSTFRIPLHTDSNSTCSISPTSDFARVIQQAVLITWDEGPMIFDAVDRTRRDILSKGPGNAHAEHFHFGGKPILICGDFRQQYCQ